MPRDPSLPSQDDDHTELAISLQASLNTAKEFIPVFTSALTRTPLLRSRLVLLQHKLPGLSNPYDLLALNSGALAKLYSRLQHLLHQLDCLIDRGSPENPKALLTAKSGPVINFDRAVRDEALILESCELLQLAIDRAWPESVAGIGDLITAKDAATDQVDNVLARVEDASKVCGRLERIYELLSKKLHGCKFMGQFPKFRLSGLEDDIIGFMFPRCVGTKGWHPMPCRMYQSVTAQSLELERQLTFVYLAADLRWLLSAAAKIFVMQRR